jgi:hypothetical protein
VKKGSTHDFGPCARCGESRTWFKSELCKACREHDKDKKKKAKAVANRLRLIQMNKDRAQQDDEYLPDLKRTREKAWDDLSSTPASNEPVPQYRRGIVQFFYRWYYEAHDEEALRRWEEGLGLGHDAVNDWDSRYGVGTRPQYVKRNTVL